jgi:hypothetical protein
LHSGRTTLFAAAGRLAATLLGLLELSRALLRAALEVRVQLGSQLLVLIVKWAYAIRQDPVVPRVLPALVVNLVAITISGLLSSLNVHDLGLVEHVHVKTEDLFVLVELLSRLLARGSHDELWQYAH